VQKTLFRKIVKEETRKQRKNKAASLAVIRKRITLAVAQEILQQVRPPERYWNIFVDATETEYDLWTFLQVKDMSKLFVTTEQLERLLLLYERWQRMCEFLIDEYDRLPTRFTGKWTPDQLLEIAGYVGAAKDTMFSEFAEQEATSLAPDYFLVLKEMIEWTRLAALGEDRYQTFLAEMKDTMQALRQHPRFTLPQHISG
jgi:hypothetical protein